MEINNLNKPCFQNLSCAFAQKSIKDFEKTENRKFSVFFVSRKKNKMKQKANKAGKEK